MDYNAIVIIQLNPLIWMLACNDMQVEAELLYRASVVVKQELCDWWHSLQKGLVKSNDYNLHAEGKYG